MYDGRTIFAEAHVDLMGTVGSDEGLGTDAIVQRGASDPVPVRVVVHDGVARVGEYGQVIGRNTLVDFLRIEWSPRRGDKVTVDGSTRPVEDIESDDGVVVTAVLYG